MISTGSQTADREHLGLKRMTRMSWSRLSLPARDWKSSDINVTSEQKHTNTHMHAQTHTQTHTPMLEAVWRKQACPRAFAETINILSGCFGVFFVCHHIV